MNTTRFNTANAFCPTCMSGEIRFTAGQPVQFTCPCPRPSSSPSPSSATSSNDESWERTRKNVRELITTAEQLRREVEQFNAERQGRETSNSISTSTPTSLGQETETPSPSQSQDTVPGTSDKEPEQGQENSSNDYSEGSETLDQMLVAAMEEIQLGVGRLQSALRGALENSTGAECREKAVKTWQDPKLVHFVEHLRDGIKLVRTCMEEARAEREEQGALS